MLEKQRSLCSNELYFFAIAKIAERLPAASDGDGRLHQCRSQGRALAGEPGPLWIWSARQSQGRGRGGREWVSQHGNLFASLLIRVNCPLRVAGQLALLAGIITFDTIAKLIAYEGRSEILLKWPNDILLAGEKVAGMLLENVGSANESRSVVVIGTGINLASHPENLPQPAVSLATYGMTVPPADALETLGATTHEWLGRWGEGS